VFSKYSTAPPTFVNIELSNKCNLQCKFCWFHGENGVGNKYKDSELTTEEVFLLINQLDQFKPSIYLGGSEPFIRKDFLSILRYIKKHKLNVAFTTNGTLINTPINNELVSLAIDNMTFSLDGDEKTHDEIRGKGIFQKVVNNIRQLGEVKKINNSKKPVITVNITLNPLTVGQIDKTIHTIREATQNNVNYYRLHHLWFITQRELREHQNRTAKYLRCKAAGATSHLLNESENFDFSDLSNELLKLNNSSQIIFFPHLHAKDLKRYYTESIPIRYRCIAPFHGAIIKPNGDMVFCPDEWIDDYILGNIKRSSFLNIWKNKKARHFRSTILRHGVFPSCKRCSWMYSFT
jgi:radical SAM protein with 4Fe4S-binding SPASM domain